MVLFLHQISFKFIQKMHEFNFQDTMFLGVSPKKAPLREV